MNPDQTTCPAPAARAEGEGIRGCPVPPELISTYDPRGAPQRDDPFPYYRWARDEQPVGYIAELDAWMVTRYDDVRTVLNDPARFSSRNATPMPSDNPPEVQAILARGIREGRIMINEDPPDHTIHRAITNQAFHGRRINALRPRIRQAADELIDEFIDDGQAEVIWQFADRLAYAVISAALGIPPVDVIRTRHWNDDMMTLSIPLSSLEDKLAAAHRFIDYQTYLLHLVEERRDDPRDDIISDLVHMDNLPGTPLPPEDIVVFVWGVSAGLNSTRDAIGSAVFSMLTERRHWEHACAEPTVIPAMFEEAVRREAPLRGLFRQTTQRVELGGVTLPKGTNLYILYGSANRDEKHFSDPDTFHPGRTDARGHFGFGGGPHRCAGSHLARTQGRIALAALTQRIPGMRLSPDYTPTYLPQYFFRGLERLDVTW
ncbi:cytochrome P450 [Streptomyces sp. SKN60]|uniref:cytochrome P450 n=1 Tax=Streptomyces sp. SKN60 TaxID=2855506 RepID=UPI002246171E|nr:cytochrome P450 [Streptomyces sp. SKN60]MCX2185025.1 cytochrome P450 [Streptomyces sp. SKN60]